LDVNNYVLVRPEHLNHHGNLFGGEILRWVDEYAWLAASLDYPGCSLVTVAMDRVEFPRPAACGAILRFDIHRRRQGTTSVTYAVTVYADEPGEEEEKRIFATHITFVRIDEQGSKTPLPRVDHVRSDDGQASRDP
jgi:acyl-CoA hydrolase